MEYRELFLPDRGDLCDNDVKILESVKIKIDMKDDGIKIYVPYDQLFIVIITNDRYGYGEYNIFFGTAKLVCFTKRTGAYSSDLYYNNIEKVENILSKINI